MTTTFKFRTYGDALHQFDFIEIENLTLEMKEAKRAIEDFRKREKEIHDTELVAPFSFSEEFLAACEAASAETRKKLVAQGYEKGKDFIKTPEARLEWTYLGSKIHDPNLADSDVSAYEIRIVK